MFEAVVAPLAAALAFHHARRALGTRRAAGELAVLAAYGFVLEALAMAAFASHTYDASWRAAPLGVPLAVAVVWAAVITSAMAVAGRREDSRGWRAGAAALVAITLDLMIEPVAARASLWSWTPPGPWLGVPVGNFVGWGVIVGAYAYGAERWAGTGPAPHLAGREPGLPMAGRIAIQVVRRIALAAACILALVLVGVVWTWLGLERAFGHGRGWVVWAAVLMATLWRVSGVRDSGGRPTAPPAGARWGVWGGARHHGSEPTFPPTLIRRPTAPPSGGGGRWGGVGGERGLIKLLAATPGRGPEAVLCVVGLAFAVEALRIAEPGVTAAAAGSVATIGIVAAGLRRRPD